MSRMKNEADEKRKPRLEDRITAKANYDAAHGTGEYEQLPTRKQNHLAKQEVFHREFRDLSAALSAASKEKYQ
jgi:hypothetical protein